MLDVYGSLGSAQSTKCAGSAIVPANYMSGGAPPAPLVGGTPTSGGASTGAKIALAVGVVAVGAVLYLSATSIGATLAANPKTRRKKLSELEQLQASLTRQWTRSKLIENVAPLVRAAGTPGGRPLVFLVKSKTSASPTERMIDQSLPGAKASGTDSLSNAKFVHSTLSYAGVLAEAGTGRPLVFYDAQEAARRNTLFGLVELREKFPRQPVLMVGYTDWREDDAQAVQLAAAALGARLIVQEDGRWVEYTSGPVSNPAEFPRPLDKTSPDVKFVVFCYAPGDPPISASFATKKDAVAWAKYKCSEEGDRYRVMSWPPPEERTRKSNDAYSPFHERLPGGKAAGMLPEDFDPEALARGTKHELEHTRDRAVAQEIAMDHLAEDEGYYVKLDAMERGGSLDNPSFEAGCVKDCHATFGKNNKPKYLKKCLTACHGVLLGKGLADLPSDNPSCGCPT